jgi:FtsP/CotA-like multicopper oxidase with cupredoxin domain
MYHSHHDEMTQMQLGMMGLFVIKTAATRTPPQGQVWCGVPPPRSPLLAKSEVTARIKIE